MSSSSSAGWKAGAPSGAPGSLGAGRGRRGPRACRRDSSARPAVEGLGRRGAALGPPPVGAAAAAARRAEPLAPSSRGSSAAERRADARPASRVTVRDEPRAGAPPPRLCDGAARPLAGARSQPVAAAAADALRRGVSRRDWPLARGGSAGSWALLGRPRPGVAVVAAAPVASPAFSSRGTPTPPSPAAVGSGGGGGSSRRGEAVATASPPASSWEERSSSEADPPGMESSYDLPSEGGIAADDGFGIRVSVRSCEDERMQRRTFEAQGRTRARSRTKRSVHFERVAASHLKSKRIERCGALLGIAWRSHHMLHNAPQCSVKRIGFFSPC